MADAYGFCLLPALVPANDRIAVHAEGYLTLQQNLDRALALDAPAHEVLGLTLQPAPSCAVQVTRPDGRPLSMAQVWVQKDRGDEAPSKDEEIVAVGVSDADGYVGFDLLAPSAIFWARAWPGWSMGLGLRFSPGPACERMKFAMQPAVQVLDHVYDDRGIAVADASVQLLPSCLAAWVGRCSTPCPGIWWMPTAA